MLAIHMTDHEAKIIDEAASRTDPDLGRAGRPGPNPSRRTRFIVKALDRAMKGELTPFDTAAVGAGTRTVTVNIRYDMAAIDEHRGTLPRGVYARAVALAAVAEQVRGEEAAALAKAIADRDAAELATAGPEEAVVGDPDLVIVET